MKPSDITVPVTISVEFADPTEEDYEQEFENLGAAQAWVENCFKKGYVMEHYQSLCYTPISKVKSIMITRGDGKDIYELSK